MNTTRNHTQVWTTTTRLGAGLLFTLALTSGASAQIAPPVSNGPKLPSSVWLLTADHTLVNVDAKSPSRAVRTRRIAGLMPSDALVGIDYRVARGQMYGLGRSGTLYRLDPSSGRAEAVSTSPLPTGLGDAAVGFDFNPAADRIRVVTDSGRNLRLHPDTGAVASTDPALAFAADDPNAGQPPQVSAAAYTYNTQNDKLTTNYAIDHARGALLMQGSKEGAVPVVSPNLGVLRTVGSLGTGPLTQVSFDISDLGNTALAVWQTPTSSLPRLYRIDLNTGTPTLLGAVAGGQTVIGLAIEP